MKFYGKAQDVASKILDAFQTGNIPQKLAWVFLTQADEVPSNKWSWSNRLMVALLGYADARGFRQWEEVGRKVKKGAKGFPILVPRFKRGTKVDEHTGEETSYQHLYGFKHTTVFGYDQTEGEPL